MPIDRSSSEHDEASPPTPAERIEQGRPERDAWRAANFDKIDLNKHNDGKTWDRTPKPFTLEQLGLTEADTDDLGAGPGGLRAEGEPAQARAAERSDSAESVALAFKREGHGAPVDLTPRQEASLRELAQRLAGLIPERWRPDLGDRADKPRETVQVDRPSASGAWKPDLPNVRWSDDLGRNGRPLFDGPPAREQTRQGALGDCGVIAAMGAVAGHRPEAIRAAVTEKPGGGYEVRLADVTHATPTNPESRPTGKHVRMDLSPDLPVHGAGGGERAFEKSKDTGWAAVLEKALAAEDQVWDKTRQDWHEAGWKYLDKPAVDAWRKGNNLQPLPGDAPAPTGYDRLNLGSTAYDRADTLARLTGETAVVKRVPEGPGAEQALATDLTTQLADGKPVLAGSRAMLPHEATLSHRLEPGHAYEVTKVEQGMVHLRNPWAFKHPHPMTIGQFREHFRDYHTDHLGNVTRHGDYTTLK